MKRPIGRRRIVVCQFECGDQGRINPVGLWCPLTYEITLPMQQRLGGAAHLLEVPKCIMAVPVTTEHGVEWYEIKSTEGRAWNKYANWCISIRSSIPVSTQGNPLVVEPLSEME